MAAVAIIDGGGANIASLQFALKRLGVESELTTDRETISAAGHIILPGVGAAADAMTRLRKANLAEFIPTLAQPLLGICLGMQLLFDSSEEENAACLGIIEGQARLFEAAEDRPARCKRHRSDGAVSQSYRQRREVMANPVPTEGAKAALRRTRPIPGG